jgi:hypothetical protein
MALTAHVADGFRRRSTRRRSTALNAERLCDALSGDAAQRTLELGHALADVVELDIRKST